MKTIFEKSEPTQFAYSLPVDPFQFTADPRYTRTSSLELPEITELNLIRHFSKLSERNMGIDKNPYPLGSCTMKYNPRINEKAADLPGFVESHPLTPSHLVKGNLKVIRDLIRILCDITGFYDGTLTPNAGAQGEYVGIRMIQAYHSHHKTNRDEMLVPDSAHGTNPASAKMAGFKIVLLKTNEEGDIDLEELKSKVNSKTAGLMLTNPNTVGMFSPSILKIAEIVHQAGGLLYYDGANLNPILYVTKPGLMGFDVMHVNLHKTFSTPHGGGGPGSGPVLCSKKLYKYLPVPFVNEKLEVIENDEESIGRISTYFGNFAVYLRAYLYCLIHGKKGLRRIAEGAVINANYLKARLSHLFTVPFPDPCMHEFVLQADRYLDKGIKASDIVKRLLDFGIHSPTLYFPQIVKECLLIEPTESESLATLDLMIDAFYQIAEECKNDPQKVKESPHYCPVKRLDEVKAAKDLKLTAFL